MPTEEMDLFYEELIAAFVDAPGVVPRDWLLEEVQTRLLQPDCRFVLLIGEPGAGKTGFMAALARSNPEWLRYFIRSDSTTPLSGGDAVTMLMRIGHQLAHRRPEIFDPKLLEIVVNQRVERAGPEASVTGVKIGDLRVSPFYRTAIRVQQNVDNLAGGLIGVEIARATLEPRLLEVDTLSHLALLDPAAALAREAPDQTIVVVVDALDELFAIRGATTVLDWLETAPELPPNLRFVLSSRPHARLRSLESIRGITLEIIAIEGDSTEVTHDVSSFAAKLFEDTAVLRKRPAVDRESAISSLCQAAEGNFAYLTAYARALRASLSSGDAKALDELLEFEALPRGLHPLYAAFARRMRREIEKLGQLDVASPSGPGDQLVPAWEGVGQRFLAVLAVARAPLSLSQLIGLGAIRTWKSAASNVFQWIVPFLDESDSEWKFFHPSLGEFLTSADRLDAADVGIDALEWHSRIVRYYKGSAGWGDIDWHAMDSYGLLHLAEHVSESNDDPAGVSLLVTFGLKAAMKERFQSDLPFRRIVETARGNARLAQSLDILLSEGLFLELVLSSLSSNAARLDPAVYGLMARLGRVGEALARVEVLTPGLHKYRSLEAICNSTPAHHHAQLGKAHGSERLVAAALEVSSTESPLVGFLGMDRKQCLRAAARALAPHDLDRALFLAEMEPDEDSGEERDAMLAVAASTAVPEVALDFVSKMAKGRAKVAADAAAQANPGEARNKLIAFAEGNIDDIEPVDRVAVISKILSIRGNDGSEETQQLEASLRVTIEKVMADPEKSAWDWTGAIISAAENLHNSYPELAIRLLTSCDVSEVNSSSDWTALSAARVWAAWNRKEECRRLLEKALTFYRSLNWYGPARDIAKVAVIAASIDPQWGDDLANEAISLVEPEVGKADEFERGRLSFTLGGIVSSFRNWDRPLALRVARWIDGTWVHGAPWDEPDGRGSALALIGLDAANDDPNLSAQLLAECLSAEETEVRLGRPDPLLADFGLFRPAGTMSATDSRLVNFVTVVTNSVNYWLGGREWRSFASPADVLRSVDLDFPATASWARAVAAAIPSVAALDLERAVALATWPSDPGEGLIALAALAEAFDAKGDPRLDRASKVIRPAAGALPRYEPGIGLETIDHGYVLEYLDPTIRARFEAAILLPPSCLQASHSLIESTGSWYLGMIWQAEKIFQDLISGAFENVLAEELETQIGSVLDRISQSDDLVGNLLRLGCALAFAQYDTDASQAWIRRISNPTIQTTATLYCLPFSGSSEMPLAERSLQILNDLKDGVPPLHRAELAALTADICVNASEDASALVPWGLSAIKDTGPMSETRGLIALSKVAGVAEGLTLLSRALRLSDRIGNVYRRNDALADLLGPVIATDGQLVSEVVERLVQSGWKTLMDALRRAMPQLVAAVGSGVVELLDTALRRAQSVVGSKATLQNAFEHLDGVWAPYLRPDAFDAGFSDPAETDPVYLSTFLDQTDVGPSLKRVQDSRSMGPDPGDDPFLRLHGRQSGLAVWLDRDDQALWRLVDIRFLFENLADAATYHRERLGANSEGQPAVKNAAPVGDDCAVFGGSQSLPLGEENYSLTSFYYIFRVGRVVVKLFAAQGMAASENLTSAHLFPLAQRAAARIRSAYGMNDEKMNK